MSKYAEIAQNIIDAHPKSVHQLLMSKGIAKKATPEVLKDAYILFGKPFISELTDIIHLPKKSSNYSEYLAGAPITPGYTEMGWTFMAQSQPVLEASIASGTEKKTIWNSLADVFDSVVKVATKVTTVTGAVANTAQTAKEIVQPSNGNPNVFQTDEKKALEEAANKKFTKNLLIIAGIVIIVLVALIVITRKK